MDETSFCSGISTARTYESIPITAQNRIQHLESENYNLNAQLAQVMDMKDVENVDKIRTLSVKLNRQNEEIESLRKQLEEKEEHYRKTKRLKDKEITALRTDLVRLRDENAELKQEKMEMEAAKSDDESRIYRNLLNHSNSARGPGVNEQVHPAPPQERFQSGSQKIPFISNSQPKSAVSDYRNENPDFFRKQCLDMDSVCSESVASESRVHLSIDAELSMVNGSGFREILNLTNAAQSNVRNYKKVLHTWKSNIHILFDQVRSTANFLGEMATQMGRDSEHKETIERILAKINGMNFTLNASLDQTREIMEGAKGMEESLAELSNVIDDSLRRSMSILEGQTIAQNEREIDLNKDVVDAHNELAAQREKTQRLEKELQEERAKIEELYRELEQKQDAYANEIQAKGTDYKKNVELLETSLVRNRNEAEEGKEALIDLSELRAALEASQNEVHKQRMQNDKLNRQVEELQVELQECVEKLDNALTAYDKVFDECGSRGQMINELQVELEKANEAMKEVDELKMKLQQLESQNRALQQVKHESPEALQQLALVQKQLDVANEKVRKYNEWVIKIAEKVPEDMGIRPAADGIADIVGKIKGYIEKSVKDKKDLDELHETMKKGNQILRKKIELGAARHGVELDLGQMSPVRTDPLKIDSSKEFFNYFDGLVFMAKVLVKKLKSEPEGPGQQQLLEDARQLRLALMSGEEFFKKNKENLKLRLQGMGPDIRDHLGHIHQVLTQVRDNVRKTR
ncbi:unnamed protein product [Bursaphelenchus xylophilus]|nr:unnamed protein product [Bursaphelenchus xylophilus]CAG9087701.1 unnamed protein product [Bursaphelenchus xylophilus]